MLFYWQTLRDFIPPLKLLHPLFRINEVHLRFKSTQGIQHQRVLWKRKETKILKVAIIGVPNAGKSTLINSIVGRNVFAVSRKVHTTRCTAKAVLVENDTQVVFLDTPGLVSLTESVKHHLEETFIIDSEEAVKEADVVGVIHDVSNTYTREKLDTKVLRLLYLYPRKHSFLILNKVDSMKNKRDLLDLSTKLINGTRPEDFSTNKLTQSEFQEVISKEVGWSHFKDIFMVSALKGDGVGDIKIYLLNLAKPGDWIFDKSTISNQNEVQVVENIVFSKLLEYLPNVVPYELKVVLEYFNRAQDGSVTAVVLIGCKNLRTQKFVMGKGGGRMKKIALGVEQDLRKFVLNDARVKLVLVDEKELTQSNKMDEDLQNHLESATID